MTPQKRLRTRRGGGWVVWGGDACVALVPLPCLLPSAGRPKGPIPTSQPLTPLRLRSILSPQNTSLRKHHSRPYNSAFPSPQKKDTYSFLPSLGTFHNGMGTFSNYTACRRGDETSNTATTRR